MYAMSPQRVLLDLVLMLADTICAIGAYYRTLPGKDETDDGLHEKYFLCALTLAPTTNLERSLAQVSLLLARCFYLLVVCRTERYVPLIQNYYTDKLTVTAAGQYSDKQFG